MAIRQGVPQGDERFDICVIGSGPAGLAVALGCSARGRSVIVLEAGGQGRENPPSPPTRILRPALHAPLEVATRQGFGGTSSWGGLCVPFDPIDFAANEAAGRLGWPIRYAEMAAWHDRAAAFLDCGSVFEDEGASFASATLDTRQFGRLTHRAALDRVYWDEIARSPRLILCLSAPVVRLVCNESTQRVLGAEVAPLGDHTAAPTRVNAGHYVVAAGGLRGTRLLLDLAARYPRSLAHARPSLGRTYMGHLTGEIATVVFRDPRAAGPFLYARDSSARWAQRRLKLAPGLLAAEGLLGTAFTLRAPSPVDPTHGDGALSIIALLGAFPGLAGRIRSERWRGSANRSLRGTYWRHLCNIVRSPAATLEGIASMARQFRVENLPILAGTASGRYALRYHAEQAPDPASRVFLDEADPTCLVVNFRYNDADIDSVVRAHRHLDRALRAADIGHLDYHVPLGQLHDAVRARAQDGYHQIGTTRMAQRPEDGTVDTDCAVHGVAGLSIASASIFPTSTSANPTFAVVAMALRLADHLCR